MVSLYKQAIKELTSQGKFHIKLGLERVQEVLELISNPQDKLKLIHVAGTNGKGSVCAILSAILKEVKVKTENSLASPSPPEGEGWGGGIEKVSRLYSKETLDFAKELRKNMTDAENILWYYLRKKQLNGTRFRKQSPIGKYIVDFVSYERKIIIELDGGQHLEENNVRHDKRRGEFLKDIGFEVLRFYNTDIFKNIEGVLESILQKITPYHNIASQGGRESMQDLTVGLFTSPHIYEYTERIKINDIEIDKETFGQKVINIIKLADKNQIHLTEFEILTVVAFEYFAQNNVDIVILETGLGGRLDATNVIKKNICSIITHIDLDHTERLGDTIEKIAFEKAGIIKQNCPVIISPNNLGFETIKKIAKEKNSQIILEEGRNFPVENSALKGTYQQENLALVLKALEVLNLDISDETIQIGLKNVKHPCRFEYLEKQNIILDGSHNPNGAKSLRESLEIYFPNQNFKFIFGCLNNKDYPKMMSNLFKTDDEIYFYHFDNPNSCSYKELQEKCQYNAKPFESYKKDSRLSVICGSFYMIKELVQKMGIK